MEATALRLEMPRGDAAVEVPGTGMFASAFGDPTSQWI